jgi:hypothetical protein
MTVGASEFIRRFLLHVLPNGFVKIRHYGFLANHGRKEKLKLARRFLGTSSEGDSDAIRRDDQIPIAGSEDAIPERCPTCKHGRMTLVERLPAQRVIACIGTCQSPADWNTS